MRRTLRYGTEGGVDGVLITEIDFVFGRPPSPPACHCLFTATFGMPQTNPERIPFHSAKEAGAASLSPFMHKIDSFGCGWWLVVGGDSGQNAKAHPGYATGTWHSRPTVVVAAPNITS